MAAFLTLVFFQHLLYVVLGLAAIFYVVLDGFDLGVGILHLFARNDHERRVFLNAIGPVWDGNEVWLVIIGGLLLAAFSPVYASLLSGFYVPMMFLVVGLIFRVAAIEFRSKASAIYWRKSWDVVFFISSLMLAFIIGTILGNLIIGMPINAEGDFSISLSQFFTPYPMLIGLTAVALFAMHGSLYLLMKTEAATQVFVKKLFTWSMALFVFFYIALSLATIANYPSMIANMKLHSFLFAIPAFGFLFLFSIPYQIYKLRYGVAFLSSCLGIACLVLVFGLGTYPILIKSTLDPAYNLTIFNASSSKKTLSILAIIVAIGVPMVVGYGSFIYHVFRGKVKIEKNSY